MEGDRIMKKIAVYTALFTDKPDYLYGGLIDYKHQKDGIDYISVDIREAQNVDLIFNKGSWWYHTKKDGTELKVQGVDKLKQFFIDNPDEYVDFQTKLQL